MKNTYITPELLIVELGTRNHLMDVSIVGRNITDNGSNVGLVKEDNSSVNDVNVWDSEW